VRTIEFKTVRCNAYLKKVKDGRYIQALENEGNIKDCTYMINNEPYEIECIYDGVLEFLKTYFEVVSKEFEGVLVGYKDIVITGYLTVETEFDFMDREFTKLSRVPKQIVKCGIVYFGNNRKRLVPLENIKMIIEEIES